MGWIDAIRRARWIILCCVCIALLVSLPAIALLGGTKILDSVATLWGSALGAAGAVGAAVWTTDRVAAQGRRQAAAMIYTMHHPAAASCELVLQLYGIPSPELEGEGDQDKPWLSTDECIAIRKAAEIAIGEINRFRRNAHRTDSVINSLSPTDIQRYFAMELDIEEMQDSLNHLAYQMKEFKMYGGFPSRSTRTCIQTLNARIQEFDERFRRSAR